MTTGTITGVNGNMITVRFDGAVAQNEVGYAVLNDLRLMCEVVRIRGDQADMQVFEDTAGLSIDDKVDFTGELLSVELGPGLLTQVFDGLQNPLPQLAENADFFFRAAPTYLPYPATRNGSSRRPSRKAQRSPQAKHSALCPKVFSRTRSWFLSDGRASGQLKRLPQKLSSP